MADKRYNAPAELAIVGSCLNNRNAMDSLAEALTVEDFTDPEARQVWAILSKQYDLGHWPSHLEAIMLIDDWRSGKGSTVYDRMITNAVSLSALNPLVTALQDSTVRRIGYELAALLGTEAKTGADILGVMDTVQARLTAAVGRQASEMVSISDALDEGVNELLYPDPDKPAAARVEIGLINRNMGGFSAGQLIVLAARPGIGKSTQALNWAMEIAKSKGPVAFYSLEMMAPEVGVRSAGILSGVDLGKLKDTPATQKQKDLLTEASTDIRKYPVYISENTGATISHIRSTSRRLKHKGGLSMIVVDYLQLMTGAKGLPREQQISSLTRGMKILAGDLECPVLLLSQLNREVESRSGGKPRLSDLRESGAIEQDADAVVFMYLDGDQLMMDLAKCRGGSTGSAPITHKAGTFKIREMEDGRWRQ